jgi:histidinol-phosphate phosphatase family protein
VTPTFDVVVPTSGRASLDRLLAALDRLDGPRPERVIVVRDERRDGPAATRNRGWRGSRAEWVAFIDDDVVPEQDWLMRLARDIAEPGLAGSQGRIRVPLPTGRRATDWERNVAGLETARWATADMAYRRSALAAVGGFDERFRRPYREDADLALRLLRAGFRLGRGTRRVTHPVGRAGPLVSLTLQAGNADDALMDALHGRGWQDAAGARAGRRTRHVLTAAAGATALAAGTVGLRRTAAVAGAAWAVGTAELAWARVAPGPRTPREVATMAATSVAMPFAATGWWLWGLARSRRLAREVPGPRGERPAAVLFDRDGTLVADVPYNGNPERVVPSPGAQRALARLRAAGVPVAIVSNQSGVGRGLVTMDQVEAVNRRIEELLGPLGPWLVCPHAPDDACACRKPAPGLVLRAAAELGVEPDRCAVIGDIGADVAAAHAAGARAVLVPTAKTRPAEIAAAPEVASDLEAAVDRLIGTAP